MREFSPFVIVSLNVRGLADIQKRRALFHFLRNQTFDVALLQETHATAGDHSFWTSMWGGPACWTRHVGVLGGRRTDLITFTPSHDGRLLEVTALVAGHPISFVNMYLPADSRPRREFLLSLRSFDSSSIDFVAGDWNSFPCPAEDTTNRQYDETGSTWRHLAPRISTFFDAAREGSASPYFTFLDRGHGTQTRLDHIFFAGHWTPATFTTSVSPVPSSDHHMVALSVAPSSF